LSSQGSSSFRAVTFDMGGTLVKASPSIGAIYSSVCADHGVDLDVLTCNKQFEKHWVEREAQRKTGTDRFSLTDGGEEAWWASLVHDVLVGSGVAPDDVPPIAPFRFAFARAESWKLLDGAVETLEFLAEAGCTLGVISNWDSQLPALIRELGISRYFKVVVVSALEGCEKPALPMFSKALEALEVEPSVVLHIGDRIVEDYSGALQAGMQARWINWEKSGPTTGPGAEIESRGHRIGTLTALREIVESNGVPVP
jgi:putative hydrolase of the HAD superfamily